MEFSRIFYLKSIEPIQIIKEADKETYEYVAKLQQDDKLLDCIRKLKITAPNIPIDIKQFEGQNLYDLEIMQNDFVKLPLDFTIDHILSEVGLSKEFHLQLFLLTYFNSIIDIKYYEGFVPKDIDFVVGNKSIINHVYDSPYELCSLNIPFVTSQRGLIRYIKENWENMEKQMNNNLSQNPYVKRIHTNTKIGIDIAELKDTQNKAYSEIADILEPKYIQEYPNIVDEAWVKKTYQDFKKMFSTLNQNTI